MVHSLPQAFLLYSNTELSAEKFIGSGVDTGEQFFSGVVDTAEQLFAGVVYTGDKH